MDSHNQNQTDGGNFLAVNQQEIPRLEQPQKPKSALVLMANRLQVEPEKLHSTLANTVFKGCSNEEMLALVVTANEYQLNPLLKEMYAFASKGGGIAPIVGFDGWMKIINRQGDFDALEVDIENDAEGNPVSATCSIYIQGRSRPTKITEYYEECRRNTEPWNTMPRRMLRHKAIMQCARVAFGISGIHDEDEAKDIVQNIPIDTPSGPPAFEAVTATVADEPTPQTSDSEPDYLQEITMLTEEAGIHGGDLQAKLQEFGNLPEGVALADAPTEKLREIYENINTVISWFED